MVNFGEMLGLVGRAVQILVPAGWNEGLLAVDREVVLWPIDQSLFGEASLLEMDSEGELNGIVDAKDE